VGEINYLSGSSKDFTAEIAESAERSHAKTEVHLFEFSCLTFGENVATLNQTNKHAKKQTTRINRLQFVLFEYG
jgi:hypothetical protein